MKFYAVKNGGAFRISRDRIKKFVDEGYSIVDENFRSIENPMRYADDKPEIISAPVEKLNGR